MCNTPSSAQDQIFDHEPGTFRWYLNEEVRFDTEACHLECPSNDVVQTDGPACQPYLVRCYIDVRLLTCRQSGDGGGGIWVFWPFGCAVWGNEVNKMNAEEEG